MQRTCYFLLIGTLVSAVPCWAEDAGWYWQEPQPPDHTVVGRAEHGSVQNPQVHFTSGQLVIPYVDNQYVSDAVQKNIEYVWKVSADGGKGWLQTAGPPAEIAAEFCQMSPGKTSHHPVVRGRRLKNGTLLAVGSYGWQNHRDTPQKRAELDASGYYYFRIVLA